MIRILKIIAILSVVTVTLALGAGRGLAQTTPPDPEPQPSTGVAWLDHIYYGAVPPDSDGNAVLMFIHGMGGIAELLLNLGYPDGRVGGGRRCIDSGAVSVRG